MPLHSLPALQPSLSRPFLHIRLVPVNTYMLSDSRTEMQPSLVVSSLNMNTTAEAEDLNITAHFHQVFYFIEEYWDISLIFTNVPSKWGSKCSAFAVCFNQIEGVQVQHIILPLLCIALHWAVSSRCISVMYDSNGTLHYSTLLYHTAPNTRTGCFIPTVKLLFIFPCPSFSVLAPTSIYLCSARSIT